MARDSKKRAYAWGFGGYGRLGHAEPKDEMIPRLIKFFDGHNRGVLKVIILLDLSSSVISNESLIIYPHTKITFSIVVFIFVHFINQLARGAR